MKLQQHVLKIRKMIHTAFQNRFEKLGLYEHSQKPLSEITSFLQEKRKELDVILENHLIEQNGDYVKARFEAIDECTFTLFNRIAAIKVMESRELFPEIIRQRTEYANRSFAHNAWLEEHPDERNAEREGLKAFLRDEFDKLASDVYIFSSEYPYALFPTADELFLVIQAFNEVEEDPDCGSDTWSNEDILGWLYESYNAIEKEQLKASGEKTEFDKVSLQSQVYTPKWVVKFLVDNSLGKQYLEMYPQSELRSKYKIANAPVTQMRRPMKMEEIKLIDPACGSGNFLLYAFDLFYDMYTDQLENYNAGYSHRDIPRLIIENNLHGVDLDERAVQIAQIGLYIKARTHRSRSINHFNVVASHFVLPEYKEVSHTFEAGNHFDEQQKRTMASIWEDLRNAYKFGSLIRVEEKLDAMMPRNTLDLFSQSDMQNAFDFRNSFITNLRNQVENLTGERNNRFTRFKTNNAITFLDVISQKYDVAVANPPYTPSDKYGLKLKSFIDKEYVSPVKVRENLYSCFIWRLYEICKTDGYMALITPQTFMFTDSFKELRSHFINNIQFEIIVQFGFGGIFKESIDPVFFTVKKKVCTYETICFKLDNIFNNSKIALFDKEYLSYVNEGSSSLVYSFDFKKLNIIKGTPFLYWLSENFRQKFSDKTLNDVVDVKQGIATANNFKFCRYWWEIEGTKDKYFPYAKGGAFNRWAGNLWLYLNFSDKSISEIKDKGRLQNRSFYLKEGITYSASGRGGYAFRYLPPLCLFDVGGSSIFPNTEGYDNIYYLLAIQNSKLSFYVADSLNPTANIQVGDIQRCPFILPDEQIESQITFVSKYIVSLTEKINSYSILDKKYKGSPIVHFKNEESDFICSIKNYLVYENFLQSQILLLESFIDKKVFDIYELSNKDIEMINEKEGIPVGNYSVSSEAKEAFLNYKSYNISLPDYLITYINSLPIKECSSLNISTFIDKLYQKNYTFEDICKIEQISPIDLWFMFIKSAVLPHQRMKSIVFEYITEIIKHLFKEDDDGVIPIISHSGEEQLVNRLERFINYSGFNSSQLSNLLGCELSIFIQTNFFGQLSNSLKMFNNLPATPFIWHISSGPYHALECYVSIYKWSRDALSRLKSVYAANRDAALRDRLINLSGQESGTAKMEKELINNQLRELDSFRNKVDELLAEGYNPILDDGVGKNIAPLQKKGLLAYEVLNKKQLEKYLNADW